MPEDSSSSREVTSTHARSVRARTEIDGRERTRQGKLFCGFSWHSWRYVMWAFRNRTRTPRNRSGCMIEVPDKFDPIWARALLLSRQKWPSPEERSETNPDMPRSRASDVRSYSRHSAAVWLGPGDPLYESPFLFTPSSLMPRALVLAAARLYVPLLHRDTSITPLLLPFLFLFVSLLVLITAPSLYPCAVPTRRRLWAIMYLLSA